MNQSIPTTMNAVQLDEPNGRLTLREVHVPRPQAGQVLIRMAAAPINPSDLGSLRGSSYSGTRQFPFIPGLEGSGTVVEAGEGIMPRLLNGRRVACSALLTGDGTWAEYMVTSAGLCAPLNKNVSMEQGAMLLVNPLTALAIFEIAQCGKHRAMVSTAAASALGGMLLRIGKRRGIPIIHVVRHQEQVDLIRRQGGEYILNSTDADFAEQLQAMAHQLQATLFLDAIGGSMTKDLAEAAPYGSTILLYSRLSNEDSILDARTAFIKQLHLDGWFLANWMREKNLFQTLRLSGQVQSLLATDLGTPVYKRLPLSAAQQGLEMYTGNLSAGKILLVANPQEVRLDG
ncbi:MAG TPA: zinc-binding dehydrogenase [Anaerolineales bacterium]|nr:zinc-binding dehydrogenase [Anaerolineales bacterium]